MFPESVPVQFSRWQEDHPWLTEQTGVYPGHDDESMDETTRYALDEMRIA